MITQIYSDIVVVWTAEPEDIPVGEFCEDLRALRSLKGKIQRGTLLHFCAKCAVYDADGDELACEYLGDCYYRSLREFVEMPDDYAVDMVRSLLQQVQA